MAISLANLQTIVPKDPPFGIIYGEPGVGKTSLASEFPATVFLQTEMSALAGRELKSFGHLKNFDDVMAAVMELYNQDHSFKTVALDSIDELEPLVWRKTCERNNWANIEAPGYGKGYVAAAEEWRDLLRGLDALRLDRRMNVIILGHSTVSRFDDPETASYSRYDFKAQDKAHTLLENKADMILFVRQDPTIKVEKQGFNKERTRAEGGHFRWIHTELRPIWNAKNRYGMPERVLYEPGQGYAAMHQYFPVQDPPATTKKAVKAAA